MTRKPATGEVLLVGCTLLVVAVIGGFLGLQPVFEARAFNKFQGPGQPRATWWDAAWTELRVINVAYGKDEQLATLRGELAQARSRAIDAEARRDVMKGQMLEATRQEAIWREEVDTWKAKYRECCQGITITGGGGS